MVLAEVTAAGRQAASAFRPIVHQHQKDWMGVLGEAEQRELLVMLHRLQERLREAD